MARQTQLVSQHLENIFHEALSKYQGVIRSYVRGRQGICALYRKGELLNWKRPSTPTYETDSGNCGIVVDELRR